MTTRKQVSDVSEWAGLSNRRPPIKLTRNESPDLLNIDFSERFVQTRPGWELLTTTRFKDASVRLDGYNDYGRITHISAYQPAAGNGIYIGVAVVIRGRPVSNAFDKTIISKGFGVVGNRFARIYYSASTGTNPTGAWVATLWDVGAGALRTIEVADGGGTVPSNLYRFVELYRSSDTVHTLKVWNTDGTVLGSSTAAWTAGGAYVTSAEDWTVGVSMTAASTVPAAGASDYASISIAEFRYYTGSVTNVASRIATAGNGWYASEIDPANIVGFTGYWKMNDGSTDNTFKDATAAANAGFFPQMPSPWSFDTGKVLGPSGLDFKGGNSVAWFHDGAAGSANVGTMFNGATARWWARMLHVPTINTAAGETQVRSQVLLWIGLNATDPNPLFIWVNGANQYEARYLDGPNIRTSTITSITATALANKRVRLCAMRFGPAGNGSFLLEACYETAPGASVIVAGNTVACTAASPNVISPEVAVGNHLTSVATPLAFGTQAPAYGVIDSLQFWYSNGSTNLYLGAGFQPFTETPSVPGEIFVILNASFNEGAGNALTTTGNTGGVGKIAPEENDGMRWDVGLVTPYRSPDVTLLFDYSRFSSTGQKLSQLLAICGCTLYLVDKTTGVATPIQGGGNLAKGGLYTATQYNEKVMLASANGQRPRITDGTYVDNLGIRAPLLRPVVTLGAGIGFNGTYYIYYTFRNTSTGVESNPSEGRSFTTAGVQQITSVYCPVSADPQVNQRRIWITLVSGGDGSTAYLAATIDDNFNTASGVINVAPAAGASLEYYNNEEAPQGSVVHTYNDATFLGGNQRYPTRLFRSSIGVPWAWNTSSTGTWIDLNLDSGNPITAMFTNDNYLTVSLGDGMARVWNTGDTTAPIGHGFLPMQHGVSGPQSWVSIEEVTLYVAERDIYATDGQSERNLTSPESVAQPQQVQPGAGYTKLKDLPSIHQTMKVGLDSTTRSAWSAGALRSRSQVWFAVVNASGEKQVLVYDYVQSIWSIYDIPITVLCESDDQNDDPKLYGAIEGYIVQLDTGTLDGVSQAYSGTVGSAGASYFSVSGIDLTGVTLHGRRVWIGKRNGTETIQSVVKATIQQNNSTTITYYGSDLALSPGDVWCVGPIPAFIDLVSTWGNESSMKRMDWIRMVGSSDTTDNQIRILINDNPIVRTPSWATAQEVRCWWEPSETFKLVHAGGLRRHIRMRIMPHHRYPSVAEFPFPPVSGQVQIHAVDSEASVVDVR